MHYRIMYPTRTKEVLVAIFLFSAAMLHVALMTEQTVPALFFLQMAALAVLIGSLCAEVCVRMKKRTADIRAESDSIMIGGTSIVAEEVAEIVVKGYRQAAVGIRLKGKTSIPGNCCFRFPGGENGGMNELARWAEQHGIPVKQGYFMTWL
ncbi:6-phosphogluconate dehydrogenase [Paenibacillus thiaminolyticus]|uniref:6-phosphogluconate dehydrogenase n=1 Tax=Paenibacillus thiaminolyticus TaxID=49283 RepID=UPI0035A65449